MKHLYLFILKYLRLFGELRKSHYYGEDFITIEFENDGKVYTLSVCREKENKENA